MPFCSVVIVLIVLFLFALRFRSVSLAHLFYSDGLSMFFKRLSQSTVIYHALNITCSVRGIDLYPLLFILYSIVSHLQFSSYICL